MVPFLEHPISTVAAFERLCDLALDRREQTAHRHAPADVEDRDQKRHAHDDGRGRPEEPARVVVEPRETHLRRYVIADERERDDCDDDAHKEDKAKQWERQELRTPLRTPQDALLLGLARRGCPFFERLDARPQLVPLKFHGLATLSLAGKLGTHLACVTFRTDACLEPNLLMTLFQCLMHDCWRDVPWLAVDAPRQYAAGFNVVPELVNVLVRNRALLP